jgi:hypothetical protein
LSAAQLLRILPAAESVVTVYEGKPTGRLLGGDDSPQGIAAYYNNARDDKTGNRDYRAERWVQGENPAKTK